jgi:cystathionine gamma-lyase
LGDSPRPRCRPDDVPQQLSAATLGLHGGSDERVTGAPFVAGPVFASAFHLPGDQAGVKYQYGRFDNPTWSALEEVIGRLEGGPALTFASGVAATAAVLTPFVQPGDTIVLPDDGYFATRSYAQTYLARWGVDGAPAADAADGGADFAGVKLVFVETPSNPSLDVVDIEALAARVHAAGACSPSTTRPRRC